MRRLMISKGTLLAALLLLAGCSTKPQEVRYGEDQCAHCKMIITDARFAAEIVTDKGKALKFDAIECLASYLHQHPELDGESAARWVSDFNNPGNWLSAEKARYVQSEEIRSPMGKSLLALQNNEEVNKHLDEYPGTELGWVDIMSLAANSWN